MDATASHLQGLSIEESDPTRIIQYEYNQKKDQIIEVIRRRALANQQVGITCTRDDFYLTLGSSYSLQSLPMFEQFSRCQQVGDGGAVNNAIHAYSKLISNLRGRGHDDNANLVIIFLTSDPITIRKYNKTKSMILTLFGEDLILCEDERQPQNAAVIPSIQIFAELQQLLVQTFTNEQGYIESTPILKQIISRFLINQDPVMIGAYGSTPPSSLLKAHFFIYVLNNIEQHSQLSSVVYDDIVQELENTKSQLILLLPSNPTAITAAREVERRYRPKLPASSAAGGKKRTLRNNNSKSYSKKIKNKNKNNKKTRRSRFSKK
jgi:hypothetical protein